ncbi:MAG: TetR family transcriptional regulator [Actinobacteria bacterium]|uniref:Unannotated protein n=1 Tax=freshwater metagenome TaxID=449393 RepID=A0A6J7AYS9_9ZZZZ|nr:TetR family transcriptional regulator [Actinomycetota bacterium]
MPRDGTATRARLLREAERLFARRGLYQVTVREILEAAGQRNVSALTYHFGSREGVLDAILERHNASTDAARGRLYAGMRPTASTRDLVAALVVPYAAHVSSAEGRDYLRIVAQLSSRFNTWREPNPGTGSNLIEILSRLEERPAALPVAIRRERVVELIMLMTVALAERARLVESGRRPVELDEPTFAINLTDVLVGILEAPLLGPLPVLTNADE